VASFNTALRSLGAADGAFRAAWYASAARWNDSRRSEFERRFVSELLVASSYCQRQLEHWADEIAQALEQL
jgi:hypothetical protein